MTPSSTAMEAVAPRELPSMAARTVGIARRQFTSPRRMNLMVDKVVPQEPESLLVAMALCTGSPASRYAGREISPPPPPMASRKPARNSRGQTMRNWFMGVPPPIDSPIVAESASNFEDFVVK